MIEFYVKKNARIENNSMVHDYDKLPNTASFYPTQQMVKGEFIYLGDSLYEVNQIVHTMSPINGNSSPGVFRNGMKVILTSASLRGRELKGNVL